ncbi:MAG: FliM/FliN family flagellar motor switch protein [bacterium]
MAFHPSEALAQDDIDRIIGPSGGGSGQVQTARSHDVQIYDFRRPSRVSQGRMRTLEVMYERLVKSLEGWLITRVRGQVELKLQSVDQISFGEYTLFLNSPCCAYLVGIKDAGGQQGVIDFGLELSYFLVDRLFGGSGGPTILERALSPIERMALRVVADRVLQQVQETWQELLPLEMSLAGFESVPEILQACSSEESVLVVNIAATFAERSGTISMCLPLTVLEKFFASAPTRSHTIQSVGSEEEVRVTRESTESQLRATRVAVSARLAEFRLPIRRLAELKEGMVLSTGIVTDSPFKIMIGSTPRFMGTGGRVGRKLAVRVLDSIDAPQSAPTTDTA